MSTYTSPTKAKNNAKTGALIKKGYTMTTLSSPAQVLLGALFLHDRFVFNKVLEDLQHPTITEEGYIVAEVCLNRHIEAKQAQEDSDQLCLISNGQAH